MAGGLYTKLDDDDDDKAEPVAEPADAPGPTNEGLSSESNQPPQQSGPMGNKSKEQVEKEKEERKRQEEKDKAKEEDSKRWYRFIGEAYIHGMMDGEAVRLHINEGIPMRMFEPVHIH